MFGASLAPAGTAVLANQKTLKAWADQAFLERPTGIEPASSAWKAEVIPLYHRRLNLFFYDSYIYKKDELWSSTQLVFTKSALHGSAASNRSQWGVIF